MYSAMNFGTSMHLPKDIDPTPEDFFSLDVDYFFNEPASSKDSDLKSLPCPECMQQSRESFLELYQINFDEAMFSCPFPSCSYPMKEESLVQSFITRRDASVLTSSETPKRGFSYKSFKKSKRKTTIDSCESFFKEFDPDSLLSNWPEEVFSEMVANDQLCNDNSAMVGPSTTGEMNLENANSETVTMDINFNETANMNEESKIESGKDRGEPIAANEEMPSLVDTEPTITDAESSVTQPSNENLSSDVVVNEEMPSATDNEPLTIEAEPSITSQSLNEDLKLEKTETVEQEVVAMESKDTTSSETRETAGDTLLNSPSTSATAQQTEQNVTEVTTSHDAKLPSVNDDTDSKEAEEGSVGNAPSPSAHPAETEPDVAQTTVNDDLQLPSLYEDPVVLDSKPMDVSVVEVANEEPSKSMQSPLKSPPYNKETIQWINKHSSCWLDSIMTCLVNSVNLRAILNLQEPEKFCLLRYMCDEYDECQRTYKDEAKRLGSSNASLVTTCTENLGRVRKKLMTFLQQKMTIEHGGFQSPLEIFPVVLKGNTNVEKYFKVHSLWHFECTTCGHERARRSTTHVVSFPYTSKDFHPLNARFERPCFKCDERKGTMTMMMEKLPPCLIFHFENGLPHSNFRVLDFGLQGSLYSVFAVIQYILRPVKHFVTWIRNIKTNQWLCCNDLEDPVCRWQRKQPNIPPSQIHMVLWERQSVTKPEEADESQISTILNNEVSSLADDIPLESFYAYEDDETIVLSEDIVMHNMNSFSSSHNGTKTTEHNTQTQEVVQVTERTSCNGLSKVNNNSHSVTNGPVNGNVCTIEIPSNTALPSEMLANNRISVIPTSNGKQAIQVVAPPDSCNIVIVMSENKNQVLYNSNLNVNNTNSPAPTSFLHDSRFNPSGKRTRQTDSTDQNEFPSYKPKRHFKLSGYSESRLMMNRHKFSPLRVTTGKKLPATSRSKIVLPQKVGSRNAKQNHDKSDSEKGSEISEMSDFFPDLDITSRCSGESFNSAPAALKRAIVTPPPSLPNSSATSPSGSVNGLDNNIYMQSSVNNVNANHVTPVQNQPETSDLIDENSHASSELFLLNSILGP